MKLSELFGGSAGVPADQFPDPAIDVPPDPTGTPQTVVLAGGCFWCTEAVFAKLEGVISVMSGYAGGTADTADYRTVCSGTMSPTLGTPIGTCYLPAGHTAEGTAFEVDVRGKRVAARVVKTPFYKHGSHL